MEPWPGVLVALTVPPWASASLRTIARPRPLPPVLPAAGLLRPPEPVEDVRQVLGGDAAAGVGDLDDDLVAVRAGADGHACRPAGCGAPRWRPGCRRPAAAVPGRRPAAGRPSVRTVRVTPARVGLPLVRGGDLGEQLVDVDLLPVQPQRARVGRGQVLEVVDDVLEQHRLLQQRGDQRGVRGRPLRPGPPPASRGCCSAGCAVSWATSLTIALRCSSRRSRRSAMSLKAAGEPADLVPAVTRTRAAPSPSAHPLRGPGERAQRPDQPDPASTVTPTVRARTRAGDRRRCGSGWPARGRSPVEAATAGADEEQCGRGDIGQRAVRAGWCRCRR